MNAGDVDVPRVLHAHGHLVVHVPGGRGEELRVHLEAHGIRSRVRPSSQAPYERLEVDGGVDADALEALVGEWER